MKHLRNIFLFILISSHTLFGQDTLDSLIQPKKYFGVSFYEVFKEEFGYGVTEKDINDYFKVYSNLVPGFEDSMIINPYIFSRIYSGFAAFEIPLSHKLCLNSATYPICRIALGYAERKSFKYGQIEQYFPYDTITSYWTGNPVYRDSVIVTRYGLSSTYKEIPVEVSLMYFNNWGYRVSGFFGIGISTRLSISSIVNVSSLTYSAFRERDSAEIGYSRPYPIYGSPSTNADATKKNIGSTCTTAELFFPFGFGLGIGRSSKSTLAMHLFYECRIGFALTNLPDLGTLNSFGIFNAFGIRTNWRKRE